MRSFRTARPAHALSVTTPARVVPISAMADRLSVAIYLFEPSDGGLDRVAILLANRLRAQGHGVELWMARREGPLADLIAPDVPVRLIPAPRGVARRLSMIAQWLPLRVMLRRHRPDILYSAGNQSNMLVAAAALGTRTQAVGRISNPILRPGGLGWRDRLRLARFRLVARGSAATIVMGAADERPLDGAGRLLHLARPTVTPAMAQIARTRAPRAPSRPLRLLAVGRLVPQKDYATLLSALALLERRDWHLRIAGQGPLLAALQRQCAELGIGDHIEFLGFVGDADALARLYGETDMLVHAARWEGFCGTVIEALACGCQVVATRSTANLDALMTAAGQQMVPVGDVPAFARAIERLWASPLDPARLARATRPFAIEPAVAAHAAAFRRLVGQVTGRPRPR